MRLDIWHNVPKRYNDARFNPLTSGQTELIKFLSLENDLVVVGGVGTGKTHILCAYINRLVMNGTYARYVTEYAFAELFTLRHSQDKGIAREAEILIHHAKNYKFLVIDEVGKRKLTVNQNIELDELLSARYDNMLRTILVSNLTGDEVTDRIGERATDRLRENGAIIVVVDGESLRGRRVI